MTRRRFFKQLAGTALAAVAPAAAASPISEWAQRVIDIPATRPLGFNDSLLINLCYSFAVPPEMVWQLDADRAQVRREMQRRISPAIPLRIGSRPFAESSDS